MKESTIRENIIHHCLYKVVANDLKSCWHLAKATKILAQESSTDMDPLAVEVRIISTQGEFCDSYSAYLNRAILSVDRALHCQNYVSLDVCLPTYICYLHNFVMANCLARGKKFNDRLRC